MKDINFYQSYKVKKYINFKEIVDKKNKNQILWNALIIFIFFYTFEMTITLIINLTISTVTQCMCTFFEHF